MHWAAAGKSTWEIAKILGLAEPTVKDYLRQAAIKLNAANRVHAVALAIKLGLIDVEINGDG